MALRVHFQFQVTDYTAWEDDVQCITCLYTVCYFFSYGDLNCTWIKLQPYPHFASLSVSIFSVALFCLFY